MKKDMHFLLTVSFMLFCLAGFSQEEQENEKPDSRHQIYLSKPAKHIIELLDYRDCTPIDGELNEQNDRVIMNNYEPGRKVYIQVLYQDGSVGEFTRSPCYIDPVIL